MGAAQALAPISASNISRIRGALTIFISPEACVSFSRLIYVIGSMFHAVSKLVWPPPRSGGGVLTADLNDVCAVSKLVWPPPRSGGGVLTADLNDVCAVSKLVWPPPRSGGGVLTADLIDCHYRGPS